MEVLPMPEDPGRLATDILISVLKNPENISLKHSDIRSAEETKQLAENINQMYSVIYQGIMAEYRKKS
jgi:hypothetical protein